MQNLYEQRRVEEDERRAAPTQARMVRLNFWNLVFVIVGVALAALMAWKQSASETGDTPTCAALLASPTKQPWPLLPEGLSVARIMAP